jgi:hypothetical protein
VVQLSSLPLQSHMTPKLIHHPYLKGALDVIRIANEAVDEAVNRLMEEAIDKVIKEDS